MAWFGRIESFKQRDGRWEMGVDFFDDLNPDKVIKKTLYFPLTVTRAQAVARIRQVGAEVRAIYVLSSDPDVIGAVIPIP